MGVVPITYIDLDYKSGIAIRYSRAGECNQCGACCKRRINVSTTDGDNLTHGSTATDGKGRWSAIEKGTHSEFIRFWYEDAAPWHKPCKFLGEHNNCFFHDDLSWVCGVFPTAPSDIAPFPDCSYVFTEIERFAIDSHLELDE